MAHRFPGAFPTTAVRMTAAPPESRFARLRDFLGRRVAPYLPTPHFMALAPLDVVLRMLLHPPARIPPIYWPRLAVLLVLSAMEAVVSLPERVVLALWLKWRPPPISAHQAPIFVLGYFRSGTTFMQTLLAADPMLRTPRWAEALTPHAFVPGWLFLRYLLIPFMPLTRIDDVVPLAATLPGEDDFGLNNWALVSTMAGRLVLPHAQPFYDRFQELDGLTPKELSRWRHYQRAFIQKLMLVSGGRRLVLKSPGHTARVRYLIKMYPGAKFVHISRPPTAVYQSNILLVNTMQRAFALQHPIDGDAQEDIIVNEYLASEQRYLADKALIPPGDLAEVRLQDLAADPIGQLKRIYREIGLPFSQAYERNLAVLLTAPRQRVPNIHPELTEAQRCRAERLEPLFTAFGHDRPPIPKAPRPAPPLAARSPLAAAVVTTLFAIGCAAAWYVVTLWTGFDNPWLVWPTGVAIGYAAAAASGPRGTAAQGALAAALTLIALLAVVAFHEAGARAPSDPSLTALVVDRLWLFRRVFYALMGTASAYWIGSGRPA